MKTEYLQRRRSQQWLWLWLVAAVIFVSGCGNPPVPDESVSSVPVKAVQVNVAPIEERIMLVASISANESVEVQSEIDGVVETVAFAEGQAVEAGQLLIRLDQRKQLAQVAEAEAGFALAKADHVRAESMFKNRTISQQEFDQARSLFDARKAALDLGRQRLEDTSIIAPFQGITGSRLVSPGQVISRNTPLTSVVAITPVKVEFRVPERYLGELSVGQAIAFRVPAYRGTDFRGEVYFIGPQVDVGTRTVLVKALQPNLDKRLRPGMFGNLDLILRVKNDAMLLPEECLVFEGDHKFVYRIDAMGKAERVLAETGSRADGMVEITSGISPGDMVIVEGLQKVRPGVPVSVNVPVSASLPATKVNPHQTDS